MKAIFTDGGIDIPELDERIDHLEGVIIGRRTFEPAHYDLKAACSRKGVVFATVESNPVLQPQVGYTSDKHGRKKYYSRAAVWRWIDVFDDDLPAYIVELLASDDRDLRNGVQAQLIRLRQAGRVKNDLWREVRDFLTIKGVA